jgi:hypothetical protein
MQGEEHKGKGKGEQSAEEEKQQESDTFEKASLAKLAADLTEKLDSLHAAIAQRALVQAETANQPTIQQGFSKLQGEHGTQGDSDSPAAVNVLSVKRKLTTHTESTASASGSISASVSSTSASESTSVGERAESSQPPQSGVGGVVKVARVE